MFKSCVWREKNVYGSLPTGYGKSMIFYALPIVADAVYGQEPGVMQGDIPGNFAPAPSSDIAFP